MKVTIEVDAEKVAKAVRDACNLCLTPAASDVLAERLRQVTVKGWTPQHDDDEHDAGELAGAAAAYAEHAADALHPFSQGDGYRDGTIPQTWPFEAIAWRPGEPRRNLVKAAALILAEIERLDRAAAAKDLPVDVVQTGLILVGIEPSLETIAAWSYEQRLAAFEWASATHFRASDNDVDVPAKPEFLPQPWQGPEINSGDVFGGRQPTRF